MRHTAFLSTAAAVLLAVSPVFAQNDFDALLGDLTFGDAPASESLTLDVAAEKAAESLKPVQAEASGGITMPTSSPAVEAIPAPQPSLVQGQPAVAAPHASAPHAVAAQPAPVQPSTDQPTTGGYIDFNQAFAAQNCDSCQGGCDAGYTNSFAGGCGRSHHEEECETCVPYHAVSLPSSTLYQYFRSNPCHTDVWNGYRNKCCFASKHTRGECDCFNKDRGCNDCNTQIYDAAPCESRVCSVPSITRTKRFFDFSKRENCDDQVENCDSTQPSCDGPGCDTNCVTCD